MQQSVNDGTRLNLNIANYTQQKYATANIICMFVKFTKNKNCSSRFYLGSNTCASPKDKATIPYLIERHFFIFHGDAASVAHALI